MASRYRTWHKRKKRSIAEEFDIGEGKYVHDVKFSSSFISNGNKQNTYRKSWDETLCNTNKKNSSSLRERDIAQSNGANYPQSTGKYVQNIEFAQVIDPLDLSNSNNNSINIDSASLKHRSDSISIPFSQNSANSYNNDSVGRTSLVAHASIPHGTLKKKAKLLTIT